MVCPISPISGGIKPSSVLNQAVNKTVLVSLKGSREYRGILEGFDLHVNLVLKSAEEVVEGLVVRKQALVLVRGDSIVFVSP